MKSRLAFSAACAVLLPLAWLGAAAVQGPPAGSERPQVRQQAAAGKVQRRVVQIGDLQNKRLKWTDLKDSDVIVAQGKRMSAGDYRKILREYRAGLARQAQSKFVRQATAEARRLQVATGTNQPGHVAALNREIAARMKTAAGVRAVVPGGLRIDSIYPDTAIWGDPVLISGAGFGATQGGITVLKPSTGPGGVHMVLPDPHQEIQIVSWSETAIVVTAPNTGVNEFLHWFLAVRTSDGKQSEQKPFTISPPLDYLYLCPWGPSVDTTEQCGDMPWPFSSTGTIRICSPCTSFSQDLMPRWNQQAQQYEMPPNPFVHVLNRTLKQSWIVDEIRFDCTYFEEVPGDCKTQTPFGDMPTPCYRTRACDKNGGAWLSGGPKVGANSIGSIPVGWRISQDFFGWDEDYVSYAGLIVVKGPKGTKPY